MNRQTIAIAIGCVAGLAAGLIVLAGSRPLMAVVPLLIVAPLPIQIATLGWGPIAGALAAAIAIAITAFGIGGIGAASLATTMLLPAAWAAHLANLARPGADGKTMVWYPLPAILAHLAIAIMLGCWLSGYLLGYDETKVTVVFAQLVEELKTARPDLPPPSPDAVGIASSFYAAVIPFAMPALLVILQVLTLAISAQITRLSGRLPRPADDIARDAGLPAAMLGLALASVAGIFLLQPPYYDIAAVAAGASVAAFGLVGLAELHAITRGRAARTLILTGTYLILVLISVPLLAFAVLGAIRVYRGNARPPVLPPRAGGQKP